MASNYIALVAATVVLLLIPGPNVAIIVATSLRDGLRYGTGESAAVRRVVDARAKRRPLLGDARGLQVSCEPSDRPVRVHVADGHVEPMLLAQRGDETSREERVPAEVEEIVLDRNRREREEVLPFSEDSALQLGLRGNDGAPGAYERLDGLG